MLLKLSSYFTKIQYKKCTHDHILHSLQLTLLPIVELAFKYPAVKYYIDLELLIYFPSDNRVICLSLAHVLLSLHDVFNFERKIIKESVPRFLSTPYGRRILPACTTFVLHPSALH